MISDITSDPSLLAHRQFLHLGAAVATAPVVTAFGAQLTQGSKKLASNSL